MLHLLFHDDWEMYGDGTGNPEVLMFEPAKRVLDLCDTYGAKYTFYAEIGQQLNMLNASSAKYRQYANRWEETLKDAIKRGHDVQLHFHPQWHQAKLINNNWQLDVSRWHSGHVEYEILNEWIGRGKQYLENLLQPVNKDYNVLSFRAGGWFCQPSNNLYKALKNNGIVSDVSVMKGRYALYEDDKYVDFRHAVSQYEPWEVDPEDFAKEQKGSGQWELPVFTEESKLPHPAYLLKKAFRLIYYYQIFQKRKKQKGGGSYSPKVIEKGKSKEYYGSFGYMHYKHLVSYVKHIQKMSKTNKNIKHLIFLTHSKSFLDYNNFEKFLKITAKDPEVIFSTTRSFINNHLKP